MIDGGCVEMQFSELFADVMVLNDIIEQAAGRQSGASDHGGKRFYLIVSHSPAPLSNVYLHTIAMRFTSSNAQTIIDPCTMA